MPNIDIPFTLNDQVKAIKKYITFKRKTKIEKLLIYAGYFRMSRYAKDLYGFLSAGILSNKPDQNDLLDYYNFDIELRKILFTYTKIAELQIKTHIANAVSLKLNSSTFYLEDTSYTETKGEADKITRDKNRSYYKKFKKNISDFEKKLRIETHKYPEFKEYVGTGKKKKKKIPCWALFSYLELGSIMYIYSYLRLDLRKEVLKYGYTPNKNYGKISTRCMDTWIDAIRNLRNICCHHNKLVLKTSSVVLEEQVDSGILLSQTDLFSRIYALKKVLAPKDSLALKNDLKKLIKKTPFDLYSYQILPIDWEIRYNKIENL